MADASAQTADASAGSLPVVLLTVGDPAGIGPEIAVAAALDPRVRAACVPVVAGPVPVVRQALGHCGLAADVIPWSGKAPGEGQVAVLAVEGEVQGLRAGVVQAAAGRIAFDAVERAIRACLDGEAAAISTAPLNKEAMRLAGVPYLDHTAALEALAGTGERVLTMFWLDRMRIFFATRHLGLREACAQLSVEDITGTARSGAAWLARYGMPTPRLAVAALNPHAGENGMFGDEEARVISPAVAALRAEGLDVTGPVAADSVFAQCLEGRYDAVVALYHDQGHIAAKTRDFERTVAVTTGLPFVRTSVDHGTAFDVAWQGRASAVSMVESTLVSARLAAARKA